MGEFRHRRIEHHWVSRRQCAADQCRPSCASGWTQLQRDKTFFVDFVPRRRRVRGQIVEIIVSRHGRRFLNLPAALQPRDHRPHRTGREDKEGRTEASPRKNKSKRGGEPKPRSHEENRNTDSARAIQHRTSDAGSSETRGSDSRKAHDDAVCGQHGGAPCCAGCGMRGIFAGDASRPPSPAACGGLLGAVGATGGRAHAAGDGSY